MLDLNEIFHSLQSPSQSIGINIRFTAYPIPGYEQHRLGKDIQGNPSLLISVIDSFERVKPASIVLEHITVQYDVDCHIMGPNNVIEKAHLQLCTALKQMMY